MVRRSDPTGRADQRLVAAITAELDVQTHASTGTRERLIRRVTSALEREHSAGSAMAVYSDYEGGRR